MLPAPNFVSIESTETFFGALIPLHCLSAFCQCKLNVHTTHAALLGFQTHTELPCTRCLTSTPATGAALAAGGSTLAQGQQSSNRWRCRLAMAQKVLRELEELRSMLSQPTPTLTGSPGAAGVPSFSHLSAPAAAVNAAVQLLQLSHTAVSLPRSVLCWTRGIHSHSGSCRALPSSGGSSIWQPQQAGQQQDGGGEFDACGSCGVPASHCGICMLAQSHNRSSTRPTCFVCTPASSEPGQC